MMKINGNEARAIAVDFLRGRGAAGARHSEIIRHIVRLHPEMVRSDGIVSGTVRQIMTDLSTRCPAVRRGCVDRPDDERATSGRYVYVEARQPDEPRIETPACGGDDTDVAMALADVARAIRDQEDDDDAACRAPFQAKLDVSHGALHDAPLVGWSISVGPTGVPTSWTGTIPAAPRNRTGISLADVLDAAIVVEVPVRKNAFEAALMATMAVCLP